MNIDVLSIIVLPAVKTSHFIDSDRSKEAIRQIGLEVGEFHNKLTAVVNELKDLRTKQNPTRTKKSSRVSKRTY